MICCIIQARTGSKRLPKKVIQKIDNNLTILDYVINQVKYSKKIEKIVIATTDLMEDDIICQHLDLRKIKYFRGCHRMYILTFMKKFGMLVSLDHL